MDSGTAFANVHINHHLSAKSTDIGTALHRLRIDSIDGVDITGSLAVDDLKVRGTLTTVHSKDVNLGDAHLRLNVFNTESQAQKAGLVSNTRVLYDTPYRATAYENQYFTLDTAPPEYEVLVGDIVQVLRRNSSDTDWDPSDTVAGLFQVDIVETGRIHVSAIGEAAFYSEPSNISEPMVGDWHIYSVDIGHIMTQGGSVSYCHGSKDEDFTPRKYQSMLNNVHSVGDILSDGDAPLYHINRVRGTTEKVTLPVTVVDGTLFKFINMTDHTITFINMDFELHPSHWTTFTFVMNPDLSNVGQWYNML